MRTKEREVICMKLLLKIVFSPVLLVLWIICGICNVFIKASAVVLSFIAILFALAGVITIITGSVGKGIAGLVIAFLLSPYGIPMLAALVLARFYGLRCWLKETIYG